MNKNFIFALIASALITVLTVPTINNLPLPDGIASFGVWGVAFVLGLLSLIGYLVAEFLARWIKIFSQLGRFAIVGVLNTVVDFAVFNLLVNLSGIVFGFWANLFKGISFIVAVINSYFWNKHWTFEFKEKLKHEFAQFFFVSVVGFGLNILAFHTVVNIVGPLGNIGSTTWANIGVLSGTFAGLAWNFIGYKVFVFKRRAIRS